MVVFSLGLQGADTLRVGGTGAGSGALQALAKAFEKHHPGRSVLVLPSIGSSGGVRAVLDGKLDVGCISRPLTPEERPRGLVEVPWATTAFVFATQVTSTPMDLCLAGIEEIYAGRRTQWPDGRPIRLIMRPRSDTAFAYLSGFTPGMRAALERAHDLPGVCIGITDQETLTHLERTPGSFGTTVLGLVVSEGRKVRVLAVDGIPPSSPDYPFALTLTLIHRPGALSPALRDFLDFLRSKAGQQILAKGGYRAR